MLSGAETFCSPLLVNALLASACVSPPLHRTSLSPSLRPPSKLTSLQHGHSGIDNRTEFWNPSNLSYKFTAEAKRLLELEMHQPRLTTIQATILIGLEFNRNGVDKIGIAYFNQAAEMAEDFGLLTFFNDAEDSDNRVAKAITAWSVFVWQT